jgi:hypothetical protein
MPADLGRGTLADARAEHPGDHLAAQAVTDARHAPVERVAHQRVFGPDVREVPVVDAHRAAQHTQPGVAIDARGHGVAGVHAHQRHRAAAGGQPLAEMTGAVALGVLDHQHRSHHTSSP